TVALGASFPLALEVAGDSAATGALTVAASAARVYTANTLGAIAGALTAGFFVVPALGIRDAIRLAALVSVAGGVGCVVASTATTADPSTSSGRGASTSSGHGSSTGSRRSPSTSSGLRARRRPALAPGIAAVAALVAIVLAPPWDPALL